MHKPSDKVKNPEADYISQVTLGYNTENHYTEKVTDWKGDTGKVSLTRTSIPNNFFNLKVNVASSDNVNNALLQKRYNDFLPYISPAKKRDSRIKNAMEFVPAILFLRENNPDISTHNEFLDTEWHFYSLGNLGDSKKTDYTRAYDPEDMNEFVIEISDNTKNNAVFQSGVYLDEGGKRQIEKFTITESTDDEGNTVRTPVSVAKPSKFIYPITKEEWEDVNNMRHWCLYNEDFDGDHSFEPRYACCGDYRDGKLVNDTTGKGKQQLVLNNEVWRAFYRWVVTSTNQEFLNELDQWCVRSAVEFFYAFTHMYTMMDNRAKNTFWHFAKTGTYRKVSKPVSELLHVYCELSGEEYIPTKDTSIVPEKTYYTEYAFDLWDYDNDTAIGINNNGELIFPYGREDTDYNIDGNPSSGYVFNGATSTFWCRLRDSLSAEITSTFNSVEAECFSATNLINQFDSFQECFPEEIWRLDTQRKYIRTFTGESIDNSKPKSDVQYLRDMMQGRKKYQRRQWMRDQEMYFGTKNLMNTVVGDNNRITFRCFTPTGSDVVVKPDYTLRITPYSDIYLSVMFGNGSTQQIRAKGGKEYIIDCPLTSMDDTQVTIYGANRIQALSDLSACYIAANNFSMATKLRKLVLGNTTPGYNNSRLTSLTLGNNALLEELDIRNCSNLTGSLNATQCNNLLRLYAEGTKLTGVLFATNGKVQVAHLPDTINTLTMRNLNNLTDFQATLSHLETLTLQGGTLDSLDIVQRTIETLRVLSLYDIDWTLADTSLLNRLLKLFYSLISGNVYISGQIRNQELLKYAQAWSDLNVTYDTAQLVTQYLVTFVNANGEKLYEMWVDRGSAPTDPVENGDISTPTIPSTAQYDFTYTGWDDLDSTILAPKTITAQYSESIRSYTVSWYARAGVLLESVTTTYGTEVNYSKELPTRTDEEDVYIYNIFAGWDKSTGFIRENTDVYAIWDRAELPSLSKDLKDMTIAEIYGVCTSGKMENYFEDKDYFDFVMGRDYNFKNVRSEEIITNTYFDGQTYIDTNIKLFDENSPSFTIAIDYEFSTSSSTDATLVSTFVEDGKEGFRLRYNGAPNIQWGDKNVQVGYGGNRNMVVLRHLKGSSILYVYGIDTSENSYSLDLKSSKIVRSRNTQTTQTLGFGAIKFDKDDYENYAIGWIYSCKIWYDDLGEKVSNELSLWVHETLRMEFIGTNRYRDARTNKKISSSFLANNLLARPAQSNSEYTDPPRNWVDSSLSHLITNRVFSSFPYVLYSIIKYAKIPTYVPNSESDYCSNYVYLPSFVEMANTQNPDYAQEGTHISYFTSNKTRIKFCKIIEENAQYFEGDTDPTQDSDNSIVEGDIWIKSGVPYMYLSKDTASKHTMIGNTLVSSCNHATDGGIWLPSYMYNTRSGTFSYGSGNIFVETTGNVNTSGWANYMSTLRGVLIGFSI